MAGELSAVTSSEMRSLEMNAEYLGVTLLQMMENAGSAVAQQIAARFNPREHRVVIYAGLGGKGGDGFVAARHLAGAGFKVTVVLIGRPEDIHHKEAKKNWDSIWMLRHSIDIHITSDSTTIPKIEGEVIVDAILGIGARGQLRQPVLRAVEIINELNGFHVAIDIPTGIESDTGELMGNAVKADLTITHHAPKVGLTIAKEHVGELVVANVGIPPEASSFIGPGDVALVVKPRPREVYKGLFGRLLVIGGSEMYSGAPALVAEAAMRTGVDLVYIATPWKTAYAIASMSPNFITVKLEGEHLNPKNVATIESLLRLKNLAVVLGPGLGLHKETVETVKEIFIAIEKNRIPLLIDADGLKAFSTFKRKVDFPLVLTPHAGEYQILTGEELPANPQERAEQVRKTANELGGVILLKGPIDIVSDGKQVKFNYYAHNPGMTVGGTGDTLSGIIGGLLAQGFNPFQAATAGAFINGAAGDFVVAEKGFHMVAADILNWIPKVMEDPMSHVKVRRAW
ncbi:NAD(P)H-hydrate dehydratase [Candidatus Bathyarchaeota archaeon]|nr:NAD(P)H-hydrate dehydratase [Candidatus Bathyarchaeota archaeon]